MDAKADLSAALAALGVPMEALMLTRTRPRSIIPADRPRCGRGRRLCSATFGELHPRVLAALDLAGPVVAFELDLDAVGDPKRRRKAPPDLPPFQPIRRDFAFLVDATVTADAVLRAARGADRTLVAGVSLFDVYQGDTLPSRQEVAGDRGRVPAARAHTDRRRDRGRVSEGVAAVAKATGATLR